MGNSPITIAVRTGQTCYAAGSKVKGTVYVSVSNEPLQVQTLILKLTGEEQVCIHRTTNNNDDRDRDSVSQTENHYEQSNHSFLRLEYPLHTFGNDPYSRGGQLQPGQYEFPFEMQLPASLPSTMICRDEWNSQQSYCEIKYKLIAILQKSNSGSGMNFLSGNPTSEDQFLEIFSVASPTSIIQQQQQKRHLRLEYIPVKKCCCFGRRGNMGMEAKLNRTMVQPHDTIQVEFRCQNQSTIKVRHVVVQLEEIVEWNCNGYHKKKSRMLDQTILNAMDFPELLARKKILASAMTTNHHHRRPENNQHQQHQQESLLGNQSWRNATLRIPFESYDTYSGQAVHIRHVLTIKLQTKGCCSTDPEIGTLIQLYRKIPNIIATDGGSGGDGSTAEAIPLENYGTTNNEISGYNNYNDSTSSPSIVMAHAQVLPDDWNAQKADIVNIPMAEAVILEPPTEEVAGRNNHYMT